MMSPRPWTMREFRYERHAILDANGAEVAEVVRRQDAEAIVRAANASVPSAPVGALPLGGGQAESLAPNPATPAAEQTESDGDGCQACIDGVDHISCEPYFEPAPKTAGTPENWEQHLPQERLADTGPKVFEAGQVWASHVGGDDSAVVFRVIGRTRNAVCDWEAEVLAGRFSPRMQLDADSQRARHAVFVRSAPGAGRVVRKPESPLALPVAQPNPKEAPE